jgi:UDP-3-O-[3-hydroxymyristoyl] glucosamine N-acyltransferase
MTALSIRDIAEVVKGRLEGPETLEIIGAAGLEEATGQEISFFHNMKYVDSLKTTKAGAVLIPEKTNGTELSKDKTWVRVANPQWAFAQVLSILYPNRQNPPIPGVHGKAIVDPTAKIETGARIGALAVIEAGAVIGADSVIYPSVYIGARSRVGAGSIIYPHVVLREDTEVGARAIIHAGTVIGADGYGFVTQQGRHHKIPQVGKVVIEDDVEIGANVTIDRATTGETRIGAGTKIDNLVHIAHNVHIGRDCLIVAQVGVSGSTTVGNRVTLAGQVGVIGHLTIGDGAIIAAQSGIMNDVAPGEVLFGSPARPHREAMKLQAVFGKLPDMYDTLRQLKKKILP